VNLYIEGRDMGINNGNAPYSRPGKCSQGEIDKIPETCEHVLKELLHAAASGTLPRSRCDDAAAHSHSQS
jgi:hypothetical protein